LKLNKKAVAIVTTFVLLAGLVLWLTSSTAMAYSPANSNYSQSELLLLAKVVYAEAAGEPFIGKVAVAAVVLNRVRSPLFPNTISGVVYEPWQFSCVGNWMFNSYPPKDCFDAARSALQGWDPTGGASFYFNRHTVKNPWLWSRPAYGGIGNHWFTY
jgi:N-acetylmuramoyl-L-alanine amidase